MDFLDPQKQRSHMIRLLAGYVLIGVAILIATLILLYQAYGFGLAKDGQVIQNGLVFLSSQPTGARIYLDGKQYKSDTNTKLQLPAGQYVARLQRDGYRDWQRAITVDGGSLQHFDYPLLFPTKITTANVKSYSVAPGLATQSPDRRWLLVQQDASPLNFDIYDIADPEKVTSLVTALNLPEGIISSPRAGSHSWKLVEWSTDNRRVVLQHVYDGGSEYVLIDREDAAESVNLTKALSLGVSKQISLRDKKFDHFHVFDTAAHTLGTTTIEEAGKVTPLLDQVLAYKSYGADMVLYVTDKGAAAGKVLTTLYDDGQTYAIREHGATGPFLLDLAQYSGDWYVAVGASADNKLYLYKNPQRVRKASRTAVLVPIRTLRLDAPNYLAFSSNTQYLMTENGTNFVDYDAEYDKGYNFTSPLPLDAPASHATWMDGNRLAYVSGGKLVVFDYDNINAQTLVPASPDYLPFFSRDYRTVYTLAPTAGGMVLTSSSLRTTADQ